MHTSMHQICFVILTPSCGLLYRLQTIALLRFPHFPIIKTVNSRTKLIRMVQLHETDIKTSLIKPFLTLIGCNLVPRLYVLDIQAPTSQRPDKLFVQNACILVSNVFVHKSPFFRCFIVLFCNSISAYQPIYNNVIYNACDDTLSVYPHGKLEKYA